MHGKNHAPEILAPVGDRQMLEAAVRAGADAVYLGLTEFNARRTAGNFDAAALQEAAAFCRARGVKCYLTFNTELLGDELARAKQALLAVQAAGVDAVIVQDMAAAALVKQYVPDAALHASTQMSVHSLEGVCQLAELGFSRAILAREMSFEELRAVAQQSPIELEVFVHGALCMSMSGQCYMSAFLGSRSGNRGLCAGPCRLPFSARATRKENDFHLSLKDHSHLAWLPALHQAGIASVKIEGRLRGPEYVAAAVSACVAARDGKSYDEETLQKVFSRSGFTDGYIKGVRNAAMFGVRTAQDAAQAKATLPMLRELYRRERQTVPVDMVLCVNGQGAALKVYDAQGHVAQAEQRATHSPAQKDQTESYVRAMQKTGGTPFLAGHVEVQGGTEWYAPAGELGALRREALEKLLAMRAAPPKATQPGKLCAPFAAALQEAAPRTVHAASWCVRFETPRQMEACLGQAGADMIERFFLPVQYWSEVPQALRARTWLELPRAEFTGEEKLALMLKQANDAGFAGFVAQNLAHMHLCRGMPLMGGFGLNISNAAAARAYRAMGCESITASMELTAGQIDQLTQQVPTAVLVYGYMPLMLTRACPLHNVHTCKGCSQEGRLIDRKGVSFPVRCSGPQGMRTIYNSVPLYLCDKMDTVKADRLVLYFTVETPQRVCHVLHMALQGLPFDEKFTRGLVFRGVS